jgi:tripartite-type tricarboxylate transporter receptor subunit TctC
LAAAQNYPTKPIRIIVPTSPGGVNDVTIRTITPRLEAALAQPVVVENRAGADTMIGTELAAKALPDGYTLLSVFDNFPLNQFLFKKVPYDAAKDFTPISLLVRGPQILVVPPQLKIRTVGELVQLAKSKPGALNYATAGAGSSSHLVVELFKATAGIDLQPVHYKGGAPAIADLLGSQVQVMFASFGVVLPHVKSGKLIALAVSAGKPVPQLPSVAPVAASYPGFETLSWVGMLAPSGTPAGVVRRLNTEISKVLSDDEVRGRFAAQAYEVVGGSPELFGSWIAEQTQLWGKVIKERKITLEQ